MNLEADESGLLGVDKGGRKIVYVLVGESGASHVVIGPGILNDEGSAESLHQRVWGG
jgi:hypothetical protein